MPRQTALIWKRYQKMTFCDVNLLSNIIFCFILRCNKNMEINRRMLLDACTLTYIFFRAKSITKILFIFNVFPKGKNWKIRPNDMTLLAANTGRWRNKIHGRWLNMFELFCSKKNQRQLRKKNCPMIKENLPKWDNPSHFIKAKVMHIFNV